MGIFLPHSPTMLTRRVLSSTLRSATFTRTLCTAREEKGSAWGEKHMHPSMPRLMSVPVKGGKGSYLEMEDGRKLLDYSTGIGVTNTGHCHPKVVKAAQEQLEKIVHSQSYMGFSRPMLNLMDRLLEIMPDPSLDCFFFANSGAEAIENAVKLARMATGRTNIVVMDGSFHGRTYCAASLTKSKPCYSKGLRPEMGGVNTTRFPYCYHCEKNCDSGECCQAGAPHLHELFKKHVEPCDVAAILIEPVLGEGGYVVPPKAYMQTLRKICDEHGILLICDEVQSGFGRTGKWFASEHFDVRPDILCMAKGIGSGLPLSCIAANRSLMAKQPPGTVGGTYNGNVVSCASACATIDVIREENLLENSLERGEQLRAGLNKLGGELKTKIDVRGLGLMTAIEFTGVPAGTVGKITSSCLNKGLILLTTSAYETIRFIPPINTSAEEIDECLTIFSEAVKEIVE